MKKKNNILKVIEKIRQFILASVASDTFTKVLKTAGKIIKVILSLIALLILMFLFVVVSTDLCNVSMSSSEHDWIAAFALLWSLCAISKNHIVKKIEFVLFFVGLFIFLWANIWYFRGFHEHAFLFVVILCILECFMYFYAKKTKKRYYFYRVISGFILFSTIFFNFKNDIHLCPSTDLRHYKEDVGEKTESGYGIFPDTIPQDAKNIEYFSTTGGYLQARDAYPPSSTYLKMTVNEEYLHHLVEIAYYKSENNPPLTEQDCSVITSKDSEFLLYWENLDKYVEEFCGKENCTLYLVSSIDMGFVIDWDEKVVKIFTDGKFY